MLACPQSRRGRVLPLAGFIALASILVFAHATGESLGVDENVFITSAALLARKSALIYRDFHYNHMPTQVLVLAGLFKLTDHLLLAARSFSAACAIAAAVAVFLFARKTFSHLSQGLRIFFSIGIGLIFLFNPLFSDAAGLAWNHDLSLLGCLLGFLALARAVQGESSARTGWAFAAGLCAAISVTTRLTFAPALVGLLLLIPLSPGLTRTVRIRLAAFFAIGFLIAASPSIWVWAQAPRAAFFGNFLYPRLNTQFHFDSRTGHSPLARDCGTHSRRWSAGREMESSLSVLSR